MHVKHLGDMSPGALVQRAAVFPCWGLDVTGRSPLLPQQTERLQTRARRAPGDACSGLRPAPLSRGERPARGPASTPPPEQLTPSPLMAHTTGKNNLNNQQHQVTQDSLGIRLPEHHRDDRVVVLVRPPPIHRRRRAPDDGAHRPQLAVREEAADRRLPT